MGPRLSGTPRRSSPDAHSPEAVRLGTGGGRQRRRARRSSAAVSARRSERDIRAQAPAGALVPAAHVHGAARLAGASRCSRSTSPAWRSRSSPRSCSRKRSTAPCSRRTRSKRQQTLPAVRLPADGAAVRALGPVRRARPAPGPARIVGSLFQVAFVAVIFARRQRRTLLQLLPLLGLAGVRDPLCRRPRAPSTSGRPARCCAPPATTAGRCSSARGKHIGDVAKALGDAPHSPIEVVGFLAPTPLPANGLRSLGSLADLERGARATSASTR